MQLGPQNPIVSMEQYVNTLRSIAEIGGFKDVDQFFNSPQMIRQQMMMQQAQQQAPQPDPEVMKFEQEMALKREKMQLELELQREKMMMEIELRKQELAAEAELRIALAASGGSISTNLPRS